ncbi:hypothetical protein BDR22DRAFT_142211 [Usnea florida]
MPRQTGVRTYSRLNHLASAPTFRHINMHDSYAVNIKMEQHYGLHHDDDFAAASLVEVTTDSPHNPSPTQNDYADFDFSNSVAQLDSMYNRPLPSSYSNPQPSHPLIHMPQWPSQITSPSETSSPPPVVQLQHRPILPLSKTVPTMQKLATVSPKEKPVLSSSRRTLTDSDRRKMCEYHNENPNVKQTEIGAMFGVERRFVKTLLSCGRTMMLINTQSVPSPKCYGTKTSISFKKKATDLQYGDPKASSQILSERYPNG